MANLLRDGMDWLTGKLIEHAGESITYSRGRSSVSITATVGKTLLKLADEYGTRVEWADQDFLIRAADLVLDGEAVEPQRGDTVRWARGGTTYVFEVLAPGNEPAWRWADEHRTMYRVHAKEVERE